MAPDREWMSARNRLSIEYRQGVAEFVRVAKNHLDYRGLSRCPCKKCGNDNFHTPDAIKMHLFANGIQVSYQVWYYHGESLIREPDGVPDGDEMADVLDDIFGEDNICEEASSTATGSFNDPPRDDNNNSAMKKHWVEVGGETNNEVAKTCPYKDVSQSDWAKLCDHFASDSQQRISERNKANRAKMTMLGGHGSKSIVAHIHESVDESGKLPSMIDTFKQLYQKNESWQSEKARKAYHEMTQRQASQSTHTTASSGGSCVGGDDAQLPPDLDIVTDVLGHRSRYKKGFGPLPRLKAFGGQRAQCSASKSTTEANVEKLLEDNEQFKQNFVVQQECMINMMKQIQQMQQQMQSVNSGFNFNMGQPMSMPPLPLFDNAATSHRSYSVEQQENDNDNHADDLS